MKGFWKKHKFAIIIVLYVAAVLAVGYFSKIFLVDKIIEKSNRIQELTIDSQLNREKIGRIPEMGTASAEYEKNKESLDVIIGASGEVEFIRSLESLAEDTNNKISLKIDEIQSDSKSKAKPVKKKNEEKGIIDLLSYDKYLQMHISLEGDYVGLVNFIHKLENFKYYVNIISINAKKTERDSGPGAAVSGNIFSPESTDKEAVLPEFGKVIKTEISIIVYKEE